MKMYILVKESIPLGFAMVGVAHASLACYLKYQDSREVYDWLNPGPFYKVVCKVTDEELEKAKEAGDFVGITESALGGEVVCVAFKPREEWPKSFKFLRVYKEVGGVG